MRVAVDDDLCGGHGVCVGLCPSVFAIDDDEGFARVIVDVVPAGEEAAVHDAVARCPARAIEITDGDG